MEPASGKGKYFDPPSSASPEKQDTERGAIDTEVELKAK